MENPNENTPQGDAGAIGESASSTSQIDYDAEIAKERARKPDPQRAADAFKKREQRRKEEPEEDEEDEEDEDRPVTLRDLNNILSQRDASNPANDVEKQNIARDIAESDKEAEYILAIHANRVFPKDMSLRDQIEESWAIANRRKIVAKAKEIDRAGQSKALAGNNSASTHRDAQAGTVPQQSSSDEQAYKRAGFTYDTRERVWTKKLPNGKILKKDPVTKQTYI